MVSFCKIFSLDRDSNPRSRHSESDDQSTAPLRQNEIVVKHIYIYDRYSEKQLQLLKRSNLRLLQLSIAHSEEHRAVFSEPPVTAFRQCKNLKDMIVRARLANDNHGKITISVFEVMSILYI